MKKETGKGFIKRWLKTFGLVQFAEAPVKNYLEALPFPESRDFELCEFLFVRLPTLFPAQPSEAFLKTAEAYARFCFAFWQSRNAFIPFPQDYAEFLRRALLGEISLLDGSVCAIAEIAGEANKDGACGFNTFAYHDTETLCESARLARSGQYEAFLTATGLAKYREFELSLCSSKEFSRDWATLKALYPDYKALGTRSVLHRSPILERGWSRGMGEKFDTEESRFRAAFNLFCWKYYLWGMDLLNDSPLLMKPSVNTTPFGTQIFIPAYMSYDARRDFNHAKISKLHRAKGIRRQGTALLSTRASAKSLAAKARKSHEEGRQKGLRGQKLLDFVAGKIGRPEIDERTLRRLLKES